MQNEVRYYLTALMAAIDGAVPDIEPFEPQYIITAVKLPSGAIEIAVNDKCIREKIEYILDSYDEDMRLKANDEIVMCNVMVV